jgi:ABC-2 type transport system ATP-binding protein
LKIVKELADSGTTVFLTTQYLVEANQLADRIAILHKSKIIASGTLSELIKFFPTTKYVENQPTGGPCWYPMPSWLSLLSS